ncbi:hypothetical protein I4U23_025673 [Adineta vaga]|nr:hypothetical protein I4U23_025673 [Adineta vaga]
MSYIKFLSIILTYYLMIKSYTYAQRVNRINLHFRYYDLLGRTSSEITTSGLLVHKDQAENAYILWGNSSDRIIISISKITCKKSINLISNNCLDRYRHLYIVFPNIFMNVIQIIGSPDNLVRYLAKFLNFRLNNATKAVPLMCSIQYIYDEINDSDKYHLSKTGLFGIIFLTACIGITSVVCIGWICISYYRRIVFRRMKVKAEKALVHSVQQMLDKSPVITFDSKNNNNPNLDDETTCSICLETFNDNEILRRLQCSHYYHTTCIDPWLLAHRSCPLCNRNIFDDTIPSISDCLAARESIQLHSRRQSGSLYL